MLIYSIFESAPLEEKKSCKLCE